MRRIWGCSVLALTLAAGPAAGQQRELTARDLEEMFYTDTLPAPKPKPAAAAAAAAAVQPKTAAAKPNAVVSSQATGDTSRRRAGVRYRIQLSDDGLSVRDATPSQLFHANQRIRLQVESNINGYLYIIQKGSSGYVSTLFPYEGMREGANRVSPATLYSVPADNWFVFDQTPGQEQLMVILSRTPLQTLPARPVARSERFAVPALLDELEGRVQSRDLKWFAEPARPADTSVPTLASIVINTSAERNDLVYAEIALKHQ